MILGSLYLNVSICLELVTLKVGELESVIGLYSTLDDVVEGNLSYERARLLAVDSKSELGEVSLLCTGPRNATGEVKCFYLSTITTLSDNVSRSTTLIEVTGGRTCSGICLVTLLDLRSNDCLKNSGLNYGPPFRALSRHNGMHRCTLSHAEKADCR